MNIGTLLCISLNHLYEGRRIKKWHGYVFEYELFKAWLALVFI